MNRVYISIGSNQNTVVNVRAALDALSARFGELAISSVYESEAVGFEGENFLNLVVALNTDEPVGPLAEWLKQVEDDNGRERNRPRFSSRTLDLDVLTYGALVGTIDGVELPRSEILSNAFVLQPLAEIAPDERHPVSGERYADLWQSYERDQRLWPIDFHWQGRRISPRT
ncbi:MULTISPECIES: 2-amino-4-hydroxy-6-hydroxymethyldihydropteridine diphosphokinase [Halomonadaceae]|uniref:2-amino-4-hydroxy-6-hydroxymethyldihydropteridine diphosphokinase n=1 Tax=Vreelandella halophila TaxID=86177 RepID=A0A9X4YF53_9GAMM|nr:MULTISPECIES: 2-amino-4-hydroxy-6-hydroxymethyldihydropteridine diphosphokinase [Halomonas]MYL28053.1 2-amino-4-hydroxy-6-hydroxymethyldihydropteridine diphosphokinase [Halomonas utahensis]MYL75780.1 2-amino-4-hydroxy-6-hydroxymethyldihydropteridine diphosphokinase [Halomonas sp. 22501_18_FS]